MICKYNGKGCADEDRCTMTNKEAKSCHLYKYFEFLETLQTEYD